MKKVFSLIALVAFLLSVSACQSAATRKLVKEIEASNRSCPIDMGIMGAITEISFDSDLNMVNVTFELSDISVLNGLKANRTLAHKAMLLSFSRGEAKQLLDMIAEAGAGLEFKFTSSDNPDKSFTINLAPDEIKEAVDSPMSEDEASRLLIETQVMMEEARCPYSVGQGMTMTRVFDDGSAVVYCCTVDENMYDIDLMAQNLSQMKDGAGEMFSDPVLHNQGALLAGQNKGLTYRYIGSSTGKSTDLTFTPDEIRGYINN